MRCMVIQQSRRKHIEAYMQGPPWPREVPVTLEPVQFHQQALETFPVVLLQNHAFVRFLYHKVHVALGLGPKTC